VRKGETGKTTTSIALAQFARQQGVFVALGDRYPQGNATGHVVTDRTALDGALTAADLFSFETHYQAGRVYSSRRPRRSSRPGRDYRIKQAARAFGERLRELTVHFDLVVIDKPSTLGFGMLAPLHGSDIADNAGR
jgi:cellulose biosynthesis protein BcsQ